MRTERQRILRRAQKHRRRVKLAGRHKWRASYVPKPRSVAVPKERVKREPKEPLCGVGVPKPLYEMLRVKAFEQNVTIVSLVAEALTAHFGVPA